MARPESKRSRSDLIAPLRVGPARAVFETLLIYAVILVLGAGALGREVHSLFAFDLTVAAWLWLICWPAWRVRLLGSRRWWARLGIGLSRSVLIGILLGLLGMSLERVLWPSAYGALNVPRLLAIGTVIITTCFLLLRSLMVIGAMFGRRISRRLRWQLMASHVAVIVVLLTSMTAVGSIAAVNLLVWGSQTDAQEMAGSVANLLRLTGNPASLDNRTAQTVFQEIEAGRVALRGEPPLAGLVHSPVLPSGIVLSTLDGKVRASAHNGDVRSVDTSWAALRAQTSVWSSIRRHALAGKQFSTQADLPVAGTPGLTPVEIGEAPLLVSHQPVAMIVLAAPQFPPQPGRIGQYTVAIFGLATILLILATAIPVLAVSGLFSYLLARNLTRRLESVSRVATAIASGDLSERAPIQSRNEIGRLALDINRMAAHLEETIGDLHRARAQAVEALRSRQELMANISHELRTPLAIVRAHLETLTMHQAVRAGAGSSAGDEEIAVPATTLQALQIETERLEALVDDLFTLSRGQTGGLEVHCEPVDVAALVDEVAALMRPLAQQDGMIALSVEARPGLPLALADADRLRQIISNLVRNAVRHTPEGGIIVLSVAAEGQWVVISVADTGEGISAEHLPHIFERFYRADESRTRSSGGAGLGLAIVRELVELMGGHVTVESTPGEGSCFRVFLPTAGNRSGRAISE